MPIHFQEIECSLIKGIETFITYMKLNIFSQLDKFTDNQLFVFYYLT
jgi:hypothetical protein